MSDSTSPPQPPATAQERSLPTAATVAALLERHRETHPHWRPQHIKRLLTGICHYVYAVRTVTGDQLIVRIAHPENARLLTGSTYWHKQLAGVPVPLAEILLTAAHSAPPYQVTSQLPGADLGDVYNDCNATQLHSLARQMVAIQVAVADLGITGPGYGFATQPDDAQLSSWNAVISGQIARINQHLQRGGVFDAERTLAPVRARQATLHSQLSDRAEIPPTLFLPDTTTKNVLIQGGVLTGIVDLDEVCFGDPLFTLALTRMSLLANHPNTIYTDEWQSLLHLDASARARLNFYTLLSCTDFMGEINQQFNRAVAQTDRNSVAKLTRLHELLS